MYELKTGCIVSDIGPREGFIDFNDQVFDIKDSAIVRPNWCTVTGQYFSRKEDVKEAFRKLKLGFDFKHWDLFSVNKKTDKKIIFFLPETHYWGLKRKTLKEKFKNQQYEVLDFILKKHKNYKISIFSEVPSISIPVSIDEESEFFRHINLMKSSYEGQRFSWVLNHKNIKKEAISDHDLAANHIFLYLLMIVKKRHPNLKNHQKINRLINEYKPFTAVSHFNDDFSSQKIKYSDFFALNYEDIKDEWNKAMSVRTKDMAETVLKSLKKNKSSFVFIHTGMKHAKDFLTILNKVDYTVVVLSPRFKK